MMARTWESVFPLQSSSSLILASISREGDSPLVVALFFILFAPHAAVFPSCEGYQSPIISASLHEAGTRPCIPPKSNRKAKTRWNRRMYRERNRIERMIGHLKFSLRSEPDSALYPQSHRRGGNT